MTEDVQYSDLDLSEVVEDTDNYLANEYSNTVNTDSEKHCVQDSLDINSEDQSVHEKNVQVPVKNKVIRSTELPMGRIKNIMKMDPDVHVLSAEAVFLVTKATEMFLETMAKETYAYTAQHKRKTIAKKDLDVVINKVDCLCFLEGAMDF